MKMVFDYIEYKGKDYPFRVLYYDDGFAPCSIRISIVSLENELLDSNCIPIDKEAGFIDDKFAYYVESEDDLKRPASVILNEIYG